MQLKNIKNKQSNMQSYDNGAKEVQGIGREVSIDHALSGCSPHADIVTETVYNDTNDRSKL